MKALQWMGVNQLAVGDVPDPQLANPGDMIVRVTRTVTCGSDLHLIGGYVPFMRSGDVIGHEFVGEVVEVGSAVRKHHPGDRVSRRTTAPGRCRGGASVRGISAESARMFARTTSSRRIGTLRCVQMRRLDVRSAH